MIEIVYVHYRHFKRRYLDGNATPVDSLARWFKNYHVLTGFNFREIQKNAWTNSRGFFKNGKISSLRESL